MYSAQQLPCKADPQMAVGGAMAGMRPATLQARQRRASKDSRLFLYFSIVSSEE